MSEIEQKAPETGRELDARVDALFPERWSPRAFESKPIDDATLASLFEAARWSPSCYNEQPWLFVYATSAEDKERFLTALVEFNQGWAKDASVLVLAFARKRFVRKEGVNHWAQFDLGAAWMSLTMQARLKGLYTHGMAGYDTKKAYEVTGVDPEEYDSVAAIAIGYKADPDTLPESYQKQEKPSPRKPLAEVAVEGRVSE